MTQLLFAVTFHTDTPVTIEQVTQTLGIDWYRPAKLTRGLMVRYLRTLMGNRLFSAMFGKNINADDIQQTLDRAHQENKNCLNFSNTIHLLPRWSFGVGFITFSIHLSPWTLGGNLLYHFPLLEAGILQKNWLMLRNRVTETAFLPSTGGANSHLRFIFTLGTFFLHEPKIMCLDHLCYVIKSITPHSV